MAMPDFDTVDDYLASLSPEQRAGLQTLRERLRKALPSGEERMSYKIPAIEVDGRVLVSFGAAKQHSALYVMSTTVLPGLGDALEGYDVQGGTLRFPIDRPPPIALLKKLMKARLAEREEAVKRAKKKRAQHKPGRSP